MCILMAEDSMFHIPKERKVPEIVVTVKKPISRKWMANVTKDLIHPFNRLFNVSMLTCTPSLTPTAAPKHEIHTKIYLDNSSAQGKGDEKT